MRQEDDCEPPKARCSLTLGLHTLSPSFTVIPNLHFSYRRKVGCHRGERSSSRYEAIDVSEISVSFIRLYINLIARPTRFQDSFNSYDAAVYLEAPVFNATAGRRQFMSSRIAGEGYRNSK